MPLVTQTLLLTSKSCISTLQHRPQYTPKHTPDALLVLRKASEHHRRTEGEDERLPPLLVQRVSPGQHRSERPRRDEQRHVLPPAGTLDHYAPAAEQAARGDADAPVDGLPGARVLPEDARSDPRPRQADAVVEQGDERAQEGGRSRGGEERPDEGLGVGSPRDEEQVQGEVGGHGPLEGLDEARDEVPLAGWADAHVDHLAREGDGHGRVAPG